MRRLMLFPVVSATVALVAAAIAVPAGAATQGACATTKAFSQFGDDANYALLVNGGLEDGTGGFVSTGLARIVDENEAFDLHGEGDGHALQLGSGDSATFHPGCVSRLFPSLRFVARSVGAPTGSLRVEVEYRDAAGLRRVTVGTLDAGGYAEWAPTPVLTFLEASQAYATQARGTFFVILTPVGTGSSWQVDDLYVDPFRFR
jgi:hypothetical protein